MKDYNYKGSLIYLFWWRLFIMISGTLFFCLVSAFVWEDTTIVFGITCSIILNLFFLIHFLIMNEFAYLYIKIENDDLIFKRFVFSQYKTVKICDIKKLYFVPTMIIQFDLEGESVKVYSHVKNFKLFANELLKNKYFKGKIDFR